MTLWLDAHLSPLLSQWIEGEFGYRCQAFRDLNFQRSPDRQVFLAARLANATILTKDADFPDLLRLLGTPPKVIWLRCGNRSNGGMKELLKSNLLKAINLLEFSDLVEIR